MPIIVIPLLAFGGFYINQVASFFGLYQIYLYLGITSTLFLPSKIFFLLWLCLWDSCNQPMDSSGRNSRMQFDTMGGKLFSKWNGCVGQIEFRSKQFGFWLHFNGPNVHWTSSYRIFGTMGSGSDKEMKWNNFLWLE